jgi:hypothetical protein
MAMTSTGAFADSSFNSNCCWIAVYRSGSASALSAGGGACPAIVASARSGKIGDGKIFIYEVAEAIRIRNGDRGESAV